MEQPDPMEKLAELVEPDEAPLKHRIAAGLLASLAGVLATWGVERGYEAWRTRNDPKDETETNETD